MNPQLMQQSLDSDCVLAQKSWFVSAEQKARATAVEKFIDSGTAAAAMALEAIVGFYIAPTKEPDTATDPDLVDFLNSPHVRELWEEHRAARNPKDMR